MPNGSRSTPYSSGYGGGPKVQVGDVKWNEMEPYGSLGVMWGDTEQG